MITSTLTSKGQTTIPQIVRRALGLTDHDRLVYEFAEGKVVLKPLKGNLLHLRGTVRPKQVPENFSLIRRTIQKMAPRATPKK